MNFTDSIKSFFVNYVNFSGRASRSEFWWTYLAWVLFSVVISILTGIERSMGLGSNGSTGFVSLLSGLVGLALIIPWLSLNWRRFHDIGKSGAFYLIFLGANLLACVVAVFAFIALLGAAFSSYGGGEYGGTGTAGALAGGAILALVFVGLLNLGFTIWYIVLMVKPSVGPNQWGNPFMSGLTGFTGQSGHPYSQASTPNPYAGQQPYGGQPGAPTHFGSQNVSPAYMENPQLPGYNPQQGWERPNPLLNPGGQTPNGNPPPAPPVPPSGQPPYGGGK